MGKIKKLIITLDIDNDFLTVPLENTKSLHWNGLSMGLINVLDIFNEFAKANNITLFLTIFCRADWQIEEIMGNVGWVFMKTKNTIGQKIYNYLSIDLQWHPHLYQKINGNWSLAHDELIQKEQLVDVYKKLNIGGIKINCSRIGECFFNNNILNTLSDLQIKCDSSSFSGRNIGHTNWENAPRHPYHPDSNNFTKLGSLSLLQVPFAMIPIHAPYDIKPTLRYFNLIYSTDYVALGIKNFTEEVIVTILHPYEILTLGNPKTHKLFGTNQTIFKNLELIFSLFNIESIFLKDLV